MQCNKCNKESKVCSCASSTTIGSPIQGPKGEKGERGSRILTGEGAPSKALGFEGDFYLDIITNKYYIKNEFCEWILGGELTGAEGPQGEPGEGTPGENGIDGQDGQDGREVELRNNGTHIQWKYVGDPDWINLVELTEIQGPQGDAGDDGCSLLQGIGVPDISLGKDCDSYLDTESKDLYLKSMGAWVKTGNLIAPFEGPEGNFSALSISSQDISEASNLKLIFAEDTTPPYYDYGNNFLTSQWVSPKDYASVTFTYSVNVLHNPDSGAASASVDINFIKSPGTVLATNSVSLGSPGASTVVNRTVVVNSVLAGDTFFIVATNTGGIGSPIIIAPQGSNFYNLVVE